MQVAETRQWDGDEPAAIRAARRRDRRLVRAGGRLGPHAVPDRRRAHRLARTCGSSRGPDTGAHGWRQVAVEIYGGPLLNSWLDRDLGLAGRLSLRDGTTRLVNVDRPLLRVPQLAIHLDRAVNTDGLKLDKQRHLQPVWGLGDAREGDLIRFLEEESGLRRGRRSPAGT